MHLALQSTTGGVFKGGLFGNRRAEYSKYLLGQLPRYLGI